MGGAEGRHKFYCYLKSVNNNEDGTSGHEGYNSIHRHNEVELPCMLLTVCQCSISQPTLWFAVTGTKPFISIHFEEAFITNLPFIFVALCGSWLGDLPFFVFCTEVCNRYFKLSYGLSDEWKRKYDRDFGCLGSIILSREKINHQCPYGYTPLIHCIYVTGSSLDQKLTETYQS